MAYGDLPGFGDILQAAVSAPDQNTAPSVPQPTGTGNPVVAALMSGTHNTLSQFGGFGETLSRAVGADSAADAAKGFADRERATAASYARPDYENGSILDPSVLAYKALQMAPGMVPMFAGGGAGALVKAAGYAPKIAEAVGAGLGAFPGAVGANTQEHEDYAGDLDQGSAVKSLLYGVPEAALQAILPAKIEKGLADGVAAKVAKNGTTVAPTIGSKIASGVKSGIATQVPVTAATEFLTQQMGDPNRSFADRASDIVSSALTGGLVGGVLGGATHPFMAVRDLSKTPAPDISTDQLGKAVDAASKSPAPSPAFIPPIMASVRDQLAAKRQAEARAASPDGSIPVPPAPGQADFGGAQPETPVFGKRAPVPEPVPGEAVAGAEPEPLPEPPPADQGAPYDWAARRKELQQGGTWSPILKGREFQSEDELKQAVFDNVNQRVQDDMNVPPGLSKLADAIGVTKDGKFTDQFAPASEAVEPEKAAMPADEPPLAGPQSTRERLEKAEIPEANQPRWQSLEDLATKLSTDDVSNPAVKSLMDQVTAAQNSIPDLKGRGVMRTFDKNVKNLTAQVAARDQVTEAAPPSVDKTAPATSDKPSPTVSDFIAKMSQKSDTEPVRAGEPPAVASDQPLTKEAQVKAKRRGTKAAPAPEPVAEAVAPTEQSPKEKIAAEGNQADPTLSPKPGEVEAAAQATIPREQGIGNDARLYEQLQASQPADIEAAQQTKEATRSAPAAETAVAEPAPTKEAAAKQARAPKPDLVSPEQQNRGQNRGQDPDRQTVEQAKRAKMMSDVTGKLKMVETSKRPVVPVPKAILDNIAAAKQHLGAMMENGKVGVRKKTDPTASMADSQRFQDLLDDHDSRLSVYERAAKVGGMEAVREIPQDFFGTDLWDEMHGKVDRNTQAMMEKYANAEQNLSDMSALSREHPLVAYDSPPTQHDMDLQNVVRNARDINDPLTYLRQNGSTIEVKSAANALLKAGLKSTVRMAEPEEFAGDTSRKLNEGEVIAGSHNDMLDRISVYNGSHMEQTLLHEAIHAATIRAVSGKGEAGEAIRQLFQRIKDRSPGGEAYGLSSPAEFVAEASSNPQFQQFLRSERVSTGSFVGDAWQALKNVVFKALGMPDRTRGLFDQVMDTTQRLMGENVREAAVQGETPKLMNRGVKALSVLNDSRAAEGIRQLDKVLEGVKIGARTSMVQKVIGWVPTDQLAERMGRWIAPAVQYSDLMNLRGVRADTLAKPELVAQNALQHLPEKMKDAFNRLAAVGEYDPRKTWETQHKDVLSHPQADILKQEHAKSVKDLDVLRGDKTGKAVAAYQQAIDAGRFKQKLKEAFHFHDTAIRNGLGTDLPGFENDPMREYDGAVKLHDSPAASLAWADARVENMKRGAEQQATSNDARVKEIDNLVAQEKAATVPNKDKIKGLVSEKEGLANQSAEFRGQTAASNNADVSAAKSPYFHHGRDGDHFVAAHISKDPATELPDDRHVQALQDMMGKNGYGDAVIARGVNNDTVYVRLNSEQERENLFGLFQDMEKGKDAPLQAGSSSRGMAHEANIYRSVGPSWMRSAIEQVQASKPDIPSGMSKEDAQALIDSHKQQKAELTRSLMDMIPDTAITKIYAPRKNVQGFNGDMIENYKKQAISNSRGLANLSLAREIGGAAKGVKDRLEELNGDATIKGDRLTTLTQMSGELLNRNRDFSAHTPSSVLDFVKKATHTVSVGMSPSYVLMLMSQIPTLSLPELGKTHGYVAGSQALAKNTALAFKVMAAVGKGDAAATFGMRYGDLIKAGISEKDTNFLMNLAARGVFNHGAYTDAMTGHEPSGGGLANTMHYMNSMSRYAEQFPRILTALAARDLHDQAPGKAGGRDVHEFSRDAVMNSQFNWNQALNARQTTRQGTFGTMSPLINQFMGYTTRMTAKLYKEAHDGFMDKELRGTPEGAEQSRQARVWMYGHLAAMTTLAGTLGLPMVSVLSSVYDQLADWATGKDNHDITASYRTFLASTFGKEAGEIIARGAPRALGIDTDHFGEGSIVPGSRSIELLTEKRKWEDAQKDWLKNMAGSAVGEIFNTYAAGRDFWNGDFNDGLIKMLPEAMKKGAEAYKLGTRGFVDKNGAQLPITASATDVMMTAMGLDPAKEAEYDEVQKTATGLKNMRLIRSANIERHLQLATNRNDKSMFGYWMTQAQEFQADHPGLRGPAQTFSRQLMLHERNSQIARTLGLPMGVNPRDQVGAGMVSYANLRNGEQ